MGQGEGRAQGQGEGPREERCRPDSELLDSQQTLCPQTGPGGTAAPPPGNACSHGSRLERLAHVPVNQNPGGTGLCQPPSLQYWGDHWPRRHTEGLAWMWPSALGLSLWSSLCLLLTEPLSEYHSELWPPEAKVGTCGLLAAAGRTEGLILTWSAKWEFGFRHTHTHTC